MSDIESSTEWGVFWASAPEEEAIEFCESEHAARQIAAAYSDAQLVQRTVTPGPWMPC